MRRDPSPGKRERLVIEFEIAVLGIVMICALAATGRYLGRLLFYG